ncbi:MAG: flavodoxin [Mesorhizobium sp.]|nr:MAG: flavodoxin [Mesorhizobium sp.]TIP71814.1 MAG: flavodoxin [Mesorhizobium sp.]TIQ14702.1 MAG: flavodoxin [Mesorhizobium sp.]TIR52386.1 MAG: flavodoxin [Mesorhizobium sp.]TJV97240.1 MAG: flavodoxin [Mesorhizobium sp.]
MSRRQALQRSLLLPLVAGVNSATASAEPTAAGRSATVLVAYFTRTGNTRLIATQIARALDATLFQIVPAAAYPEDYEAQVAQAEDERQRGYEPPLQATVPDLSSYETVFLGFPIWGMTAPSVIRSFLSQHDMSGKTLVPFITHGGYGLGNSLAIVAEHAPGARLIDGFSEQCDQERETLREVTQWLASVGIGR